MSLLRRNNSNDNNQNNNGNQQQATPQPAPNPAPAPANNNNGGLPSRFARGNNNTANNANNANNAKSRFGTPANRKPAPPKSWRYDGAINRFGASDLAWVIAPIDTTFVRFDLRGLGDPFHRLLGEDINFDNFALPKLLESLETDDEQVIKLTERLDSSWENYKMSGATIMHSWTDDIKEIIATVPKMQKSQLFHRSDDDDEFYDDVDDNANSADDSNDTSGVCLRSIDMLLVLNVLGRTKSNILLGNSQLILEEGFLNRSLVTNDPRLVAIAQATGCVEEHFTK